MIANHRPDSAFLIGVANHMFNQGQLPLGKTDSGQKGDNVMVFDSYRKKINTLLKKRQIQPARPSGFLEPI